MFGRLFKFGCSRHGYCKVTVTETPLLSHIATRGESLLSWYQCTIETVMSTVDKLYCTLCFGQQRAIATSWSSEEARILHIQFHKRKQSVGAGCTRIVNSKSQLYDITYSEFYVWIRLARPVTVWLCYVNIATSLGCYNALCAIRQHVSHGPAAGKRRLSHNNSSNNNQTQFINNFVTNCITNNRNTYINAYIFTNSITN